MQRKARRSESARQRGRSRTWIAALALVSLVLGLATARQLAGAEGARISLTLRSGPPSSLVTVAGSGFRAEEEVTVAFDTTAVGRAASSAQGTFTARFRIPTSAAPGRHHVTTTGQTSGLSATASFLVRARSPKFRLTPGNSGHNPHENVIGPGNVSKLATIWTASTGDAIDSSPAVDHGTVYVGSDDGKLYAFSASGTANCSTTYRTCAPLWTAATFGPIRSSPAVANGVVYVGSEDDNLYAFSAAGTTNCSGTPKTCKPLWVGMTHNAIESSPSVAGGIVYVGSEDRHLYAFSTSGSVNCSGRPKICRPLWTGTAGPIESSPAVVDGVVYVGSDDFKLYAFSAAGTTNCGGTPKRCKPLWFGRTGGYVFSSPAVADGVVYVGSEDSKLYAFSANGTSHCRTLRFTKRCRPLWTGDTGALIDSSPAITASVVYIASDRLYAFAASDQSTRCSGAVKTCEPLWTARTAGYSESSPTVANGVVYLGGSEAELDAFSASGTANCSGEPKACQPLLVAPMGYNNYSSPAVVDGVVYIGSADGKLYAFSVGSGTTGL